MILVMTLGFDEKFALRAIFRRGLRSGDRVIFVVPEDEDPRADRAFSTIQQIVFRSVPEVSVERFRIPVRDFPKAVSLIRRLALSLLRSGEKVVLNLSGGQRIAILEVLAGFLSCGAGEVEVEVESEDSSTLATFPLIMMTNIGLDHEDVNILKILTQAPRRFNEIQSAAGISKSSTWRRLKKLMDLGLVEKVDNKYKLTELGQSRIINNP
jgi:CRISPR-associated protein Csa3